MAILTFEDFDSPVGNLVKPDKEVYTTGGAFSTSYGYNGSNGHRANGLSTPAFTAAKCPTNPTTAHIGIRMRYANGDRRTDQATVRIIDSGGGTICELRPSQNGTSTSGEVNVFNAANSNIGTTSGFNMTTGGPWNFYEIELVAGTGANGSIDILVNGASVFSATGQDFTDGNDDIAEVRVSGANYFGSHYTYVSNMQICDTSGSYNNTFPQGEIVAEYILPDGDGNQTDWTPDTGSTNYTQVDEDPRDNNDYVQSGTLADIDLYTYAAVASSSDAAAVDVIPYCLLPDGGSRFIRGVTRISATNYTTSSVAVVDTDAATLRYEENPNTTAAWTASDIDGAEFGYEVRDS